MRLITFAVSQPGAESVLRAGVHADGDVVVDVDLAIAAHGGQPVAAPAADAGSDSQLLTLLRGGERALEATREATGRALAGGDDRWGGGTILRPASEVQIVSPLPRPNSLRDFLAIKGHLLGCIAAGLMDAIPEEWYTTPSHYKGNVDEIYGPDDTVPWPPYTEKLDYELEICAVIGTAGRRIGAEDAGRHIVGYTIFNDWSARDIQVREGAMGTGPALAKDFASSLGPCIATPEEFDRENAHLEARIDGEVWSTGKLGAMHFSFEELVEWTSQEATLRPGDLLGSGTVGGGCGLELGRWLEPGSVVEIEAEGIGVLRNRVGRKGEGPRRVVETLGAY